MSQPKKSLKEILSIVDRVKFLDRNFRILVKGPIKQSTRKYYISPYMTETEIVETAWLAAQRSQLHIASEHFTYDGRRVYSQHFSIGARIDMCDGYNFDSRIPIETK